MLHSTREGLRAATRPYCVKLRTDSRVDAARLRAVWEAAGGQPAVAFEERVGVGNLFSRDPRRSALLFHLSDIFLVGRRTDLLRLFDAAWDWVASLERGGGRVPWLCPEQFLWLPTLRGTSGVALSHGFDFGPRKVVAYERAVRENVFVLDGGEVGLEFSKAFGTSHGDCYSQADLRRYDAAAAAHPTAYRADLILRSAARSVLSQVLLLNLGVKSRLLRLLRRGA